MNDIIFRSLSSAGIPASKEPTGLTILDGKRPDGLTLALGKGGKPVCDMGPHSGQYDCSVFSGGSRIWRGGFVPSPSLHSSPLSSPPLPFPPISLSSPFPPLPVPPLPIPSPSLPFPSLPSP